MEPPGDRLVRASRCSTSPPSTSTAPPVSTTCCASGSGTSTTGPRYDVRQRLVAVPPARHGAAPPASPPRRRLRVAVPAPVRDAARVDRRGNTVVRRTAGEVPAAVEFTVAAVVERDGPLVDTLAAGVPRWPATRPTPADRADPAGRGAAGAGRGAAGLDGRTTPSSPRRRAPARRLRPGVRLRGDLGVRPQRRRRGRSVAGVCQDSAHVLLAALPRRRACRRGTSPGHLLGQHGGSHAWVEVLVRDGARVAGARRRPVQRLPCRPPPPAGRGRARLRRRGADLGWYRGEARGRLTWTKHAGITAVGF